MKKAMIKILCVLAIFPVLIAPLLSQAQIPEPVNLQWKIANGEKITYLTKMQPIDSSKFRISPNPFSEILGEDRTVLMEALWDKLQKELSDVNLITELQVKQDNIVDIIAYAKHSPENENEDEPSEGKVLDLFMDFMQGVMLRGSVFKNGGIHSFWVMSKQKNIISMFFELPTKPVKVGDSWSLDIALIANDQNFECDSSSKINRVTLTEIKRVGNETIATLKYEISEFVQGTFYAPSFSGKNSKEPTTLFMTFDGLAEFSVEKGRWYSYNGLMTLNSTGFLQSNQKTFFSLTEKK